MKSLRIVVAISIAAALVSCERGGPAPQEIDPGSPGDARYGLRVTAEPGAGGSRRLHVEIDTLAGWHLADEAPVRLRLEPSHGLDLDPPEQEWTGDFAPDATHFAFEADYRCATGRAGRATGILKFGICRQEDRRCVIVRRDLALELPPG